MKLDTIRIGSRGSPLAMWQANWIKSQLEALHDGLTVEIIQIKTSGDKILDVPLAKIGGKGLFVKEIEEALLRDQIDIAVHSMKDVPVNMPDGLSIPVITQRENPLDALISKNNLKLSDLPQKARVGTGSLRRTAQLLKYRPDLEIVPLRGNINTRIKKLETEGLDAVILATAGLRRMGWQDKITESIDPDILLPAMGQGAIGIEARRFDVEVMELIVPLDDEETHAALDAERAFLKVLEGGCQVPIGDYAVLDNEDLWIRGLVASLDGKEIIQSEKKGNPHQAKDVGESLANELLKQGADKILKEIYE